MVQLSLHCSECGRRADEASREVDERYRAAWMEKHVGSEFDGTISGVTSFGLFVELAESKVNGLVHVTQLPNDYYHFDPVRKTLSGERSGATHRLGDSVRVLVLRASVEGRRIDFRIAPPKQEQGVSPKAARGAATASTRPGRATAVEPDPFAARHALKKQAARPTAGKPKKRR
jgi:ribonuclease R